MPDVYGIDVIWPEILADEFVDLRTYIPEREIAAHFPGLIASYSVKGKLVALPYTMAVGALFYRVDLLRQYGYREPPKNWDELEAMAARIQKGERAKGHADFWGYVWPGAPAEALACNALEWQASEGGGTVIENGTVTVDTRIGRAWERAARARPPFLRRSWSRTRMGFIKSRRAGQRLLRAVVCECHRPWSGPHRDRLQMARGRGAEGVAATFATGLVFPDTPATPVRRRCWSPF